MNNHIHSFERGDSEYMIVHIHGNSSSSHHHDPGNKSRQFSFDLPGCGQSFRSESPNIDYSFSGLKQIVKETIDNKNAKKLLLVGHSLGGHIALEIASQLDNLLGLVLLGTPPLKLPLNMTEAYLPNPVMEISLLAQSVNKTLKCS